MADLTTQPVLPSMEAEYQAALGIYIAETQDLLDQMQTEQADIDRLKHNSRLRDIEFESLKRQTQEILTRLETMI